MYEAAGNLFGVSARGGHLSSCQDGVYKGCGVVFKRDTKGKESILYSFKGAPDGACPSGRLLLDNSGNLYGATPEGGATGDSNYLGCGTTFELDGKGHETVLYAFSGGNDGANPTESPIMDKVRNLYGTASSGGEGHCYQGQACGLVFNLTHRSAEF